MRALMGLSCSQSGISTLAGTGALTLTAWARVLRGLGGAGSAVAGVLSFVLLRTGLAADTGATTRLGLLGLTGARFCMFSSTGTSTTGSGFLTGFLRCATFEPSAILTEWGLSLRINVDFFKVFPSCVQRTADVGAVAGTGLGALAGVALS